MIQETKPLKFSQAQSRILTFMIDNPEVQMVHSHRWLRHQDIFYWLYAEVSSDTPKIRRDTYQALKNYFVKADVDTDAKVVSISYYKLNPEKVSQIKENLELQKSKQLTKVEKIMKSNRKERLTDA